MIVTNSKKILVFIVNISNFTTSKLKMKHIPFSHNKLLPTKKYPSPPIIEISPLFHSLVTDSDDHQDHKHNSISQKEDK